MMAHASFSSIYQQSKTGILPYNFTNDDLTGAQILGCTDCYHGKTHRRTFKPSKS